MHSLQRVKFVALVNPAVIKNNASFTSAVIDTLGWDYLSCVFYLGATDIAMAALYLQESDNNSSWSTIAASNFADNTQLDMDGTALALPDANADNTFVAVHLDMKKRKRYVKCVATAGSGTAGTYMCAWGVLSRGEQYPNTSAKQGAAPVVIV